MLFTAKQKLESIEREIKQRLRVYPRLIAKHKMTRKTAEHECDIMREIAEDYRRLAIEEGEQLL
jgi:hypothetical protein